MTTGMPVMFSDTKTSCLLSDGECLSKARKIEKDIKKNSDGL